MSPSRGTARPVRPGRRAGPGSTRESVLRAARTRFAADGFGGTTIRAVAADAGVDPSQVMQFFGSKEGLFAAVMAVPASALDRFTAAFDGPDEHVGERVVRAFLQSWEERTDEAEPLMAMLRGAIVNEHAREQLREFLQSRLLVAGAGRDGGDLADQALRAGLASSMLVGLVTARQIIGVPLLADCDPDVLVARVAPAIQAILVPHHAGTT